MKDMLLNYTEYNLWANKRVCDFLRNNCSEEQLSKEIISSFPSLKKTLFHIWDAEYIWIARLNHASLSDFPSKNFTGTIEEALTGFLKTSEQWISIAESADENYLQSMLTYKNIKGVEFTSKMDHIIHHVMNHSTFHRGQIITMLRQLGFTELFATDYIAFCRD